MAKQAYTDLPQYIYASDAEAAANGGIIKQFPTSLTTREQVGVNIISVDFLPSIHKTGVSVISGATYVVSMGLTQLYNAGVVPSFGDVGVVDWFLRYHSQATAVGFIREESPWRRNYPIPKLVHPAALFWFFKGTNQVAAISMEVRLEFTYQTLSMNQFQDILQTIVLQNAL